MRTLLIRNARMVNEGRIFEADLMVHHGRIDKIATSIAVSADEEIDAAGQWMLPGMIDDQVHFREPGLTHKGCIATESAAAVARGITSFMDMPNTRPPTLSMAAMADKKAIAACDSLANYAFQFCAANDNLDAVAAVDPRQVAGLKVFMGASTGNMLVDDPAVRECLFTSAPTILIAHCAGPPKRSLPAGAGRNAQVADIALLVDMLADLLDAASIGYCSPVVAAEQAPRVMLAMDAGG